MIPVTQTKVSVINSAGLTVVNGNCYAACIASILEVPISEVPNVETLFFIEKGEHRNIWWTTMQVFLNAKGWDLSTDDRFRVFHDKKYGIEEGKRNEWIEQCRDKLYFLSGKSPRGMFHITIWKNGEMVWDPHPTHEGIDEHGELHFEYLEKKVI